MATIADKQVLEINLIRIKDVIVRSGVHKYPFGQTVCKADSMPHFVDCYIRLLATRKRTRKVYVTTCGKTARLNSIEVTVGSIWISHSYCHTVRIPLAGFDEPGIQTCTFVPGCNSFVHFRDPIGWYILGLKVDNHLTRPISLPWNLMIVRILVL